MSDTDHLKKTQAKSLEDDSKVSEAELHETHPNIKEGWEDLQALRREIAQKKQAASRAIDDEYRERLNDATSNYAFLLTMTR